MSNTFNAINDWTCEIIGWINFVFVSSRRMSFIFAPEKKKNEIETCVIKGVPTSLGYAKCNFLKIRKVCERSELRLQNIDPIKRGDFLISTQQKGVNFDPK